MARKPDILSDRDNWGAVLNDYLDVSLAEDGTLKGEAIGEAGGVFGVGVRRIIASTDPDYPLEDGDLLVLIEVPTFFTDFTDTEVDAVPEGWTQPWAETTWAVIEDAGATGGKALRATVSGLGRNLLAWTALDASADAEIVYKWRSTSTNAQVRAVLRGSGDSEGAYGYGVGYFNATTSSVWTYIDGTIAQRKSSTDAPDVVADTWFITRTRINTTEARLATRTWLATDPEPGEWELTWTPSEVTDAGFLGVMATASGTTDFDWVGVAFDGATAPMEG